jgi:hypothetical protein
MSRNERYNFQLNGCGYPNPKFGFDSSLQTKTSKMPAVNPIINLPHFISKDEHTTLVGSTPNSFNDIPPVIRHKEENVSISLDPPLEGFSNTEAAQGTLYVLTRSAQQ